MSHPVRFGAMYLLLGALVAASVAGLILGVTNHSSINGKASKASVAALTNPSRDSAVKAACAGVTSQAAAQGVIIKGCKLASGKGAFQEKGDTAQVAVLATDGATNYTVLTVLSKGVWNVTGSQILAAQPVKK